MLIARFVEERPSMTCHHLVSSIGVAVFLAITQAVAADPPATAPAASGAHTPLRIVIVGDSTVCEYPETSPNRGWGHYIEERFKDGAVKVINLAAGGRSTKTFIQEGRWAKALAQKPDYVLIQFGHNDSHDSAKPEATDPATDFREYLRRYIDESRAIGATPILVTPMVRRTFDSAGKISEGATPTSHSLMQYADAMKDVAAEKSVAVIDLHASSLALMEKLGTEASAKLANKAGDNTHFNEQGARAMAGLVMHDLPAAEPRLTQDLKAP
jgi:lysophospholipase L1-like esterase